MIYDRMSIIVWLPPGTMTKWIVHGLVHRLGDRNSAVHFRNFRLTDRQILFPIGTVFRKYFPEIPKKSEFRRNSDRKVQLSQTEEEDVLITVGYFIIVRLN